MTNLFEWKAEYSCGIEVIDHEHQFLIELINRICLDLENVQDKAVQLSLLREVEKYVEFHFLSEENIMRRLGYPELEWHQRLHYETLECLVNREVIVETTKHKAKVTLNRLMEWFEKHIQEEDMKFANYVREHGLADYYVEK